MTELGLTAARPCRAAQGLLAALVGLALVLAAIVVGAIPAAAQNRVGASTPVMINTVGAATDISPGQRLGKTVLQPSFVVATGVAADAAGGAGGETTSLFRVSPAARGTSELDHGLDAAHFPRTDELDGAAHFGNEARVDDFAASHAETHGTGLRIEAPNSWLEHPDIQIWEGRTTDQLEYVIPRELFGELNQFPRFPWSPGE